MTTMEESMPPLLASRTLSPSPSASPPTSTQNQTNNAVSAAASALSMSPSEVEAVLANAINAANGDSTTPPPQLSEAATSTLLANLASSSIAGSSGSVDGLEKEERPCLSYKDLIIEAIESSAEKRLKLSEIYQVIRILHPYYRKRADQWGWQNSIRHNLSLHDCFVKLPLKQTSASGVVGHFWTVVRDREDKQSSSRRRNRNSNKASRNNGRDLVHSNSATSMSTKIKDRQSVSSDSGVMSDESQASSPAALLMDSPRKDSTIVGASPLSTLAQFQRSNSLGGLETNSVLQRLALNALLENATSNPITAALAAAVSPPVSVGTSNILMDEVRRLQLQMYLQQQQQQSQPQIQILQQLLEAQHQQQQQAAAAAAAASAVPSLLSQLLLGLKTKDVAPVPQIPVASPPVSSTLDLLSMLQGGLSTQPSSAPAPASPQQSVAEPATSGAGIDLARLLSSMAANASTHQLQSPPTSSSGLNPLLEQQLLAFSNQSPPASSKDNLCVM